MESSSKLQPKGMAVLCSLVALPEGGLRVVIDDAQRSHDPGAWTLKRLFTHKDYPSGSLDDVASLSEAELAEFGFSVLVRLLAINKHGA